MIFIVLVNIFIFKFLKFFKDRNKICRIELYIKSKSFFKSLNILILLLSKYLLYIYYLYLNLIRVEIYL